MPWLYSIAKQTKDVKKRSDYQPNLAKSKMLFAKDFIWIFFKCLCQILSSVRLSLRKEYLLETVNSDF